MTDSRNLATAPFDLAGYLLLAVGMVALTISLDGLADLGLQHAIVLVLLVLSLACFVAYRLHAVRVPQPIFSLDLFKIHTFCVACSAICSADRQRRDTLSTAAAASDQSQLFGI